jgi:hypothetical protein
MTIVFISLKSQQYQALASNRFNPGSFAGNHIPSGREKVSILSGGFHRIDAGIELFFSQGK